LKSNIKRSVAGLPSDPTFPVSYELSLAFQRNLQGIIDASNRLLARAPADPTDEATAVKGLAANVAELSNWIFLTRASLRPEEAVIAAEPYREFGEEFYKSMVCSFQKQREGRFPTKRPIHIKAFEFMLESKSNSLNKAVKTFCDCGARHGPKCRSSFKTGIQAVKEILKKHAPHLVASYNELHPDRNKRYQ
jgi:hypothetical protein